MPKVSEMFPSKFLRKEDVDDDVLVTIKDVKLEDVTGDGNAQRWVMYFRELPKGLVFGSTVSSALTPAFGSDTDDWIGQKVTLYVDHGVQFKGKVVGGLRLRPHRAKAKLTALAGKPAAEDFNDEIPA